MYHFFFDPSIVALHPMESPMKCVLTLLALFSSWCVVQLHAASPSSERSLILILLGPPGSGKGTQATKLSQKLSLPHISTGDLFRENIRNQTALGQEANRYISQGKLVPDALTIQMLSERIAQTDCKQGYLLDGFPRTLEQAKELTEKLPSNAQVVILNLEVGDETLVQRATGRLICRQCGHLHHREFSPPQKAGICDRCSGELYQRQDDAAAVVQERLRVYHRQTEPVIAYYEEKGLLKSVDGERAPDLILGDLLTNIASAG